MNYESKMNFHDEGYLNILQRKKVNKFRENCDKYLRKKVMKRKLIAIKSKMNFHYATFINLESLFVDRNLFLID